MFKTTARTILTCRGLMKDDINDILERLMATVEAWRLSAVSSICANHQVAAFHIAVLTEEKFRVYALTGFSLTQESLKAHIHIREDVFAAEWALRSLQLPDHSYTDIRKLRNSWNNKTAAQCNKVLTDIKNYSHIRDLVICAKRGGYIVETPDDHTFIFKNTPDWNGIRDFKSKLISGTISEERNKILVSDILAKGFIGATSLYDDFPHSLQTSNYSGADFWHLWEWLFNFSISVINEGCKIRNYGSYVATSETKELTVLITKKMMMDLLARETGLSKSVIGIFLRWLTFNSQTPKKFTLFHCPLVEINDKFLMILPHTILMAHIPTVFFRLLAQYDKTAFDSASSYLEKQTLKRLKTHLEGQGYIIKTNIKLDTPTETAELDFVEYEELSSTFSVGQAKLTVRADSVAEVDHTNEVLKKGLAQLERDKKLLCGNQSNMKLLFEKLGVLQSDNVNIEYFLLPTCFTGSDFLQTPSWVKILPVEFCLQPQYKGHSICSVWTQYMTLWDSFDEKVVSSRSQSEFEIAGLKISYPGLAI